MIVLHTNPDVDEIDRIESPLVDVMIDIETLGDAPDGMIVQIGAALFDPFSPAEPQHPMRLAVDICEDSGRLSQSTLCWWMEQSDEARRKVFLSSPERIPLSSALQALRFYVGPRKRVWASCSGFDLCMLRCHASRVGLPWWDVTKERDARTLRRAAQLVGAPDRRLEPGFVKPHDALEDAIMQISELQANVAHLRSLGIRSGIAEGELKL